MNLHSTQMAVTRQVSPSIQRCELTYLQREPIDYKKAHHQHLVYEQILQELGCHLISLPAEPDLPDAVFVEDIAVVLDELAVITRPGALSRRPERESISRILSNYLPTAAIAPPGTLDGGDVLRYKRTLFVGLSSRSNPDGISQLAELVKPYGYRVKAVRIPGFLHLKSAVTQIGPETMLITPGVIDRRFFGGRVSFIEVDRREPNGANALWISGRVLYPMSYPRTRDRLAEQGIAVHELDISELQKAEGAVTCCSLLFHLPAGEGFDEGAESNRACSKQAG